MLYNTFGLLVLLFLHASSRSSLRSPEHSRTPSDFGIEARVRGQPILLSSSRVTTTITIAAAAAAVVKERVHSHFHHDFVHALEERLHVPFLSFRREKHKLKIPLRAIRVHEQIGIELVDYF